MPESVDERRAELDGSLEDGSLVDRIAETEGLLEALGPAADWRERCRLLTRLALALEQAGDPARARQTYADCLNAVAADAEHGSLVRAQVLRNLGALERELGDRELARDYVEQALALFERAADEEGIALALVDLGLIDKDRDRIPDARAQLERAVRILERREAQSDLGHALAGLGLIAERLNRGDEARSFYERALAAYQAAGDRINEAVALHNLAMLLEKQDRYTEALELLRRSLGINRETGSHIGQIDDLCRIAGILAHTGHAEQARGLLERVVGLAEEVQLPVARIDALVDLALLDRALREFAAADVALDRAQAVAEAIRAPHHVYEVCLIRGDTSRVAGDWQSAIRHYRAGADSLEAIRAGFSHEDDHLGYFSEPRLEVYDRLVDLYVDAADDTASALEWSERARARGFLVRLRSSRLASGPEIERETDLRRREENLLQELADVAVGAGDDLERLRRQRGLEQAIGAVLVDLESLAPEYVALRRGRPATWHEIRQMLRG